MWWSYSSADYCIVSPIRYSFLPSSYETSAVKISMTHLKYDRNLIGQIIQVVFGYIMSSLYTM